MTAKTTRLVAALAAIATISACTHSQAWSASGEAIAALGQTFVATGHAMDAAYDAHTVTPEQYRRWAAFAHHFKALYDTTADRWLHADDSAAEHAAAVLAALSAELAEFTAMTKGAP